MNVNPKRNDYTSTTGKSRSPIRALSFSLISATLFSSCQISLGPQDPKIDENIHASDDIIVTSQQVRLRMRSLVDPMSGEIEAAADRIIAEAETPDVRRAALEWKAQAVPALREALFQPAPMTALFDTWAFTNQMTIYFLEGPGQKSLGKHSVTALSTCLRLEQQIAEVAASMTETKDVSKARDLARKWAAAHPIDSSIAYRETTLSRAAELEPGPMSASQTVADITMTVDDLNRRMEVYSDQLLRQVRWEAELLTMDLTSQLQLDQAMPLAAEAMESVEVLTESVDSITTSVAHAVDSVDIAIALAEKVVPSVDRLVAVVESAPELIAAERTATLEAVQQELNNTITFIQKERIAALEHVTSERLAALQTLHDSIIEERQKLTKDVATISTEAIDHAFWRASQLLFSVLVIGLAACVIGFFLLRRTLTSVMKEWQATSA